MTTSNLRLFPTLKLPPQQWELCFLFESSVPPVGVSLCDCKSLLALAEVCSETSVCHLCFKIRSASASYHSSDSVILPANANCSLMHYLPSLQIGCVLWIFHISAKQAGIDFFLIFFIIIYFCLQEFLQSLVVLRARSFCRISADVLSAAWSTHLVSAAFAAFHGL